MFNYRRVYTSSAKFKTIYKGLALPFFVNTRIATIFSVLLVVDLFLGYVFNLYTLDHNGWTIFSFLLVDIPVAIVLDVKMNIENLPFEVVLKMMFNYFRLYVFKHNQLYQDKRLDTNNKKYRFM